jgi:phage shock protein A
MAEGFRATMMESPETPAPQALGDQDLESLALAGAAAIQRLISERNSLRNRVDTQEREIIKLRARNEDLCRHITQIRDDYLRLATEFLSHLKQIDIAIRKAVQRASDQSGTADDAILVSLAQRLSPNSERTGGEKSG